MIIPHITGGIEPVFLYAYIKKNILGSTALTYDVNPLLEAELRRCDLYTPEILQKITSHGTLEHIEEIPEDMRKIFRCAHDISASSHVRVQARFQKYVDNAISKVSFNVSVFKKRSEFIIPSHRLATSKTLPPKRM